MDQAECARTVLVVEDDEDVRDAMRELLELRSYHVVHAPNGRDALRALSTVEVDLIVLDLAMPEMSGWGFLDEREKDDRIKAIPVLVVSAIRDAATELDARIQRLLFKPFAREAFVASVRALTRA